MTHHSVACKAMRDCAGVRGGRREKDLAESLYDLSYIVSSTSKLKQY